MEDLTRTQHFTENWNKILFNINFKPEKAVDPFAGNCDLVLYSPSTEWELYDIDVKRPEVVFNDSLLNPIDYVGKTVITNPPYLAKNKTKEFQEVFEKYNTDDLYKASILSILDCENGILIIPINFFTDEATEDVRIKFLSKFKIEYVNYFISQVFENTTYNVCSFYFERGETSDVEFFDFDNKKSVSINLDRKFGYRVGGEFYAEIFQKEKLFSRVKSENDDGITDIFVNCIDRRGDFISASYDKNHYIGKSTDRVFATLCCSEELTKEQQLFLIDSFNRFVSESRKKYNNLIFTNYRDFGRKRISFDDVYNIFTKIYIENFK